MKPCLDFQLLMTAKDSRARLGKLKIKHAELETPIFMPVGTHGTVRAQTAATLAECNAPILLANTYHLLLRPGIEVLRRFGGLHKFMNWPRAILTDSGGYQVFSMKRFQGLSEEGATFQSYVDCQNILLTPELSIETQKIIGSDIMMVLDQCIPSTSERSLAVEAMERTTRWAARSLKARGDSDQAMFAIVQGACFPDLRKQSAEALTQMPFDGFAIGGLAVGETKAEREDTTAIAAELLPADKPRYLMGVGTPLDLLEAVHRGVDMFDCILPNALAEQGTAFTARGKVDLRRGIYRLAEVPLDTNCGCTTCKRYSRAYLHHLTKCKEVYGWHLIGAHNLFFYDKMMSEIRAAIRNGTFLSYYHTHREILGKADQENPVFGPKKNRNRQKKMTLGNYEIVVREDGAGAIKHTPSGEVMHSVVAPEEEARRLYIEPSQLFARLKEAKEPPLILWDVGLGGATNAMAAVRCLEASAAAMSPLPVRALEIFSFENDLDALKLAGRHTKLFTHLQHPAPGTLLHRQEWKSKRLPVTWKLLEGDFLQKMSEAPAPDLVFFDPFSAKTDTTLWTRDCFEQMLKIFGDKPAMLFTYSNSTAVRESLLAAGFFVAKGGPTGPKTETTIALTRSALGTNNSFSLLGSEWMERWERSHIRVPELEGIIRAHPQFQEMN